jgi:nucleotide-binding universal stress UspA family protein
MAPTFRVLCGIDFLPGTTAVFAEALALSRGQGGDLTLLNVVSTSPPPHARAHDEATVLAAMQRMAKDAGVTVRMMARRGGAAVGILDVAHGAPFNLVVLGARRRQATWFRSPSVSAGVLRHSHVPVLVVPLPTDSRRSTGTFRVVLCPTDLATTPADALEVDLAVRVARWGRGSVSLLHVYHGVPPESLPPRRRFDFSEWDRRRLLLRAASLRLGTAAFPRRAGPPVWQVTSGTPSAEILRIARDLGADIVVMRKTPRGTLRRRLFGSTVERVRQHVLCPLLVLPALERAVPAAACWPARRDEPAADNPRPAREPGPVTRPGLPIDRAPLGAGVGPS